MSSVRYATIPLAVVVLVTAACAAAATPSPSPSPIQGPDPWAATAAEHRGLDGERFTYECPAGGEPGTIWGSDIYTDDSSVCTAGVHAGAITLEEGGTVTIEIRPGEESYEATNRNGVESRSYPAWGGSFVVVID